MNIKNVKSSKNENSEFNRRKKMIGYLCAFTMFVVGATCFVYRDNIAAWWAEITAKDANPGWTDENLGEIVISDDAEESTPIPEYISDFNGIQYEKKLIPTYGYSLPIPIDEKWESIIRNDMVVVTSKDYTGKYGNIEYGLIKVGKREELLTATSLLNAVADKLGHNFKYTGFNRIYKSQEFNYTALDIDDSDDNYLEVVFDEQTFLDANSFTEDRATFYSKYIFFKDGEEYFILYGIAPKNKNMYLDNMMTTLYDNFYRYNPSIIYYPYMPAKPSTDKIVTIGNGKVNIPNNLSCDIFGTYSVNEPVTSPMGGTKIFFDCIDATKGEPKYENFSESFKDAFKTVCDVDVLDGQKIEDAKITAYRRTSSEEQVNGLTRYCFEADFAYTKSEILLLAPYTTETRVIGYVVRIGSKDYLIAGTCTSYNASIVKEYLKNIANTLSV